MSLDFAILGFLCSRPMTGYELKKIFDTSVNHFFKGFTFFHCLKVFTDSIKNNDGVID